jgi:putative ABC transport system permease protein
MTQTAELPRLPRALLRLVLHGAERDEVLDDMADEYSARRARDGGARARRWLWSQVLRSAPALLERSWFRGRTGFESEADRMSEGGRGLEGWIVDVRFALRTLRARPQYALLSILTLALGIGGTTVLFGIARALLLNPLPYHNTDELVHLWNPFDWSEAEMVYVGNDWPGFQRMAAYTRDDVFMRPEGGVAQLLPGIAASAALFDVLGTRPMLGTGFERDADIPGAERTVMLSYGMWQDLGARRDIVGTTLQLDGTARRVVGVMPAGFWFPDPSVRVWLSTPMRPDNGSGNYALVGRMEGGRTIAGMGDALGRITQRLSEQFTYPPQWDKTKNAQLTPVRDYLLGPVRPAVLAALAGMGVILLMACANVATLMLGQLRGRSSELAVRISLGAVRRRIAQQLVIEAGVLAVIAGVVGAIVAVAGFRLVLASLPLGELSRAVRADWTLFVSALAISFVTTLLIALAPLFSLWRGELRDALQRVRSGGIGGRSRIEEGLVITEVALAVLLAAGAAMLIRSVANLNAIDPGVATRGIGVVDITASGDMTDAQRRQQMLQIIESLSDMPGVTSVGAVQRLPLRDRGDNWGISIQSQPDLASSTTAMRVVSRDYFDVMGIELVSGRTFDATDVTGGELAVVIDEALARKYFGGTDPIGQFIASAIGQGWMRVVGVVRNVAHDGLTAEQGPGRYVLLDQYNYTPEGFSLVMRVERGRNAAALLEQAVRRVQQVAANVAIREATTMQNVHALAMGPTRRIMQLMTLLGSLALTLGAVGVYGVVSHFVNRRRRDWIIRMALGMNPADAISQVIRRGALLVTIGCAIGVAAALLLMRTLTSLLYNVGAADPFAIAAAVAALIATGCIAAAIPGLRASRANPAQVLRDSV